MIVDKRADLAGPGIGDYEELEKILPQNYTSLLSPKETQKAIFAAKNYIEENLSKALNLMMVTVPLIVDVESGEQDGGAVALVLKLPAHGLARDGGLGRVDA